jgi:hypothetical protein
MYKLLYLQLQEQMLTDLELYLQVAQQVALMEISGTSTRNA